MLATKANYSGTSLSEAARGLTLPSLDVTLAYVGACEGDLELWKKYWLRTAEEVSAAPSHAGPTRSAKAQATFDPVPTSPPEALERAAVRGGRIQHHRGTDRGRMVSRAGSKLRRPATVLVLVAGSWALATGLRGKRSARSA